MWIKTLKWVCKTSPKILLKSCIKQSKKDPIYRPLKKLAVTVQSAALATVGRPPGRPANGQKTDRWASGRPRPGTESRSLCRSTGPVDRGFPESRSSLRSTGSVDRPSSQNWCARLCTSVDRPTPSSVDRSGRAAEARPEHI